MAGDPRSALEKLENLKALDAQRQSANSPRQLRRTGVAGGVLVLAGLAWKLKAVFAGIKFASVATTTWTMLVMAWAYSFFYGWPFAAGFVALILVHELGHGVAAAAVGLRVGAPVFIPFVGAFISLKERPRSTFQDFVIGAGGPIAGSAGGAACLALSFVTESGFLRALGFFTLVLNFFNLIPVWQLDGARMIHPVRALEALVGYGILAAVLVISLTSTGAALNPIALFVVGVGLVRHAHRFWSEQRRGRAATAVEQLERLTSARTAIPDAGVSLAQRRIAWAVYFGLAAALTIAVHVLAGFLPEIER